MRINTSGILETDSKELELQQQYSLGDIISATEPIGDGATQDLFSDSLLPVRQGPPGTLLKKLFDDEYATISLDKEDAVRIAKSVYSLRRGGSAGQRLICLEHYCEFNRACELYKTKLGPPVSERDPQTGQETVRQDTAAPAGQPCPYEEIVVQDARMRYSMEFDDLTDDGQKVIEGYINDLCQIEMMVWRCNMVMAADYSNPLIQSPGAVTSDGQIVWKPEANPVLEIQERLQARKTRILNDLVKTPREKYKKQHAIGVTGDDSLGRHQAAQRATLKLLTGTTIPSNMQIPEHVKDNSKAK